MAVSVLKGTTGTSCTKHFKNIGQYFLYVFLIRLRVRLRITMNPRFILTLSRPGGVLALTLNAYNFFQDSTKRYQTLRLYVQLPNLTTIRRHNYSPETKYEFNVTYHVEHNGVFEKFLAAANILLTRGFL